MARLLKVKFTQAIPTRRGRASSYDLLFMCIVVVGAGAAGLVAAIAAAERSPVVVLERTADGGRKILISGGGRCNILPTALQPERFVSESPAHLVRRLLRAWPLAGQRQFFESDVGVPIVLEPATGKLFPRSGRARDVRDRLIQLARRRRVTFRFSTAMTGLDRTLDGWRVQTPDGAMDCRAVVLATGGLSVPSTGSDGGGLRVAARLGHVVHPTYPALTPLFAEPVVHAHLAGVSLPVRVRGKWRDTVAEANGGFLFTHRGYSGPATLDVSHLAVRSRMAGDHATLRIAWTSLDVRTWERELAEADGLVRTTVARHVPPRLADTLLADAGVPADRRAAELRRTERTRLVEALTAFVLPWTGDEGYKKAEVTGGGVALDEVDPRTLESRRHPRLFLCGEMLDAFGPIGGHNFAWAWATGRAAGLGASGASVARP